MAWVFSQGVNNADPFPQANIVFHKFHFKKAMEALK